MKKLLLFSIAVFCSGIVFAQVPSNRVNAKEMLGEEESLEEIFPYFDAKVFHDRQFMSDAIVWLYGLQMVYEEALNHGRVKTTQDLFNEKDSAILEKNIENKKIRYDLTETELVELLKRVDKDPAGTFKTFLMTVSMPKLTHQELDEINSVDEKAISRRLEMITNSGPDFGANQVSVVYLDEN